MEQIENNRLIAEFMGMKHLNTKIDSHNFEQYTYSMTDELSKQVYGYTGAQCFLEDQFSNSWDWLMPVVEKIESLGYEVNIWAKSVHITKIFFDMPDCKYINITCSSKIEAVYSAVIQFIEWYNNQNNPSI